MTTIMDRIKQTGDGMSATASLPTPRVDVIPERWALIDQIRLSPGAHNRPSGNDLPTGMCVMEFDSWLTGGWGDRPECVSPVLWPVFQRLNDRLQDEPRQALLLYGIRALGTAGDGLDEQRRAVAWAAVPDMLVPWLRLAGLDEEADAVLTAGDVAALRTACRAAYDAARTARIAARARLHKRVEKRMRKELEKRLAAEAAVAAVAAVVAEADWVAGATWVAVDAGAAVAAVVAGATAVAVATVDAGAAWAAEAAEAAVAAVVAVAAEAAEEALAAEAAGAAVAAEAAGAAWAAEAADPWGRAYQAVKEHLREHPPELPAEVTELAEQQRGAALELLARLIDPTQDGASCRRSGGERAGVAPQGA